MPSYGAFNPALTKAINRIAAGNSEAIFFDGHAFDRELQRTIDHDDVVLCLKKGKAYGPEIHGNDVRANVVHLGIHVRVAIGGLAGYEENWSELSGFVVITVMDV